MTDERKNEIWAMLSQDEKEDFQGMYQLKGTDFDKGYNAALDEIFGYENLTAQADASKVSDFDTKEATKEEPKAKELANSFQSSTDWNKYRLDLAKELAVKVFAQRGINGAIEAVNAANEIVKRLKETEE